MDLRGRVIKKWGAELGTVLLALALGVLIFAGAWTFWTYDPLEYTTPQTVVDAKGTTDVEVDPKMGIPIVRWQDQSVFIQGTKCNTDDHSVRVDGEIWFAVVAPVSRIVPIGKGSREFPPGCDARVFDNDVQPLGDLLRRHGDLVVKVEGKDTPQPSPSWRPVDSAHYDSELWILTADKRGR